MREEYGDGWAGEVRGASLVGFRRSKPARLSGMREPGWSRSRPQTPSSRPGNRWMDHMINIAAAPQIHLDIEGGAS